ncbi:MAG: DUF5606 domain-containing protein [Bacteroidia bacterium]
MELKDIVSISGKSGLHKVLGRSKTGIIVETIGTGVKFSTGYQDKVSVLSDISMYTLDGDVKLAEVLYKLKENGNVPEPTTDPKKLRKYLIETINIDSERVYDNDIKKLIKWYHTIKDVLNFESLIQTEDESGVLEESTELTEENTEAKQ